MTLTLPPAIAPAEARDFAHAVEAYAYERSLWSRWEDKGSWSFVTSMAHIARQLDSRAEYLRFGRGTANAARLDRPAKEASAALRALAWVLFRAARGQL